MTQSDYPEFLKIVAAMAVLKGKQLTPEAFELYWNCLRSQGFSIDEFRAAAGHLANTCRWFPEPYDFEQLRAAVRELPGEAWARALEHIRGGGWRDGAIGDHGIDRAIACLGGWRHLAMTDENQLHFIERRFCDHFVALRDADETREALPQLVAPADRIRLLLPTAARELLAQQRRPS